MKKFIFTLTFLFVSFVFAYSETNEELVETFMQRGTYLKVKDDDESFFVVKSRILFMETEENKISYAFTDNDNDAHENSVNTKKVKVYLDSYDNLIILED